MSDDRETRHLTDRQYATILCALQSERDRLKAAGYTGNDCQDALNTLEQGYGPGTYGITYRLGEHTRLISVEQDTRFE